MNLITQSKQLIENSEVNHKYNLINSDYLLNLGSDLEKFLKTLHGRSVFIDCYYSAGGELESRFNYRLSKFLLESPKKRFIYSDLNLLNLNHIDQIEFLKKMQLPVPVTQYKIKTDLEDDEFETDPNIFYQWKSSNEILSVVKRKEFKFTIKKPVGSPFLVSIFCDLIKIAGSDIDTKTLESISNYAFRISKILDLPILELIVFYNRPSGAICFGAASPKIIVENISQFLIEWRASDEDKQTVS